MRSQAKNRALTRKESRKQQRQERKQSHALHHQNRHRRSDVQPTTDVTVPTTAPKRKALAHPNQKATIAPDAEQRRLKKLSQTNPRFFALLQESNLIPSAPAPVGNADNDQKAMSRYAKKLRLKSVDKISDAFRADGLDDLLDFTNKTLSKKGGNRSDNDELSALEDGSEREDLSDAQDDSDRDESSDADNDSEDVDFSGLDSDATMSDVDADSEMMSDYAGSDVDEDASQMDFAKLDSEMSDSDDMKISENDDDHFSNDSDSDEQSQADTESKSESESENSKPDTNVSSVNAAASDPATKYVPPHLRRKESGNVAVKRALQGAINRLTQSTILSIASTISELYLNHPRNDVSTGTIEILLASVCEPRRGVDELIVSCACLMTLVAGNVGSDVAALCIQKTVEQLDQLASEKTAEMEDGARELHTKQQTNMFTFLCLLFRFHVVGAPLIISFLAEALRDPNEVSLSWTIDAVRIAGSQLRAVDPEGLLALIKPLLAMQSTSGQTVRFKFMLEQLIALKNNTHRSNSTALEDLVQSMLKMVRNHFKGQGGMPFEPFRVGLSEIRSADKVGRWWVVGAAWAGHDAAQTKQVNATVDSGAHVSVELKAMAKKLSINTDIRKRIFFAIMTAEDYLDAVDRLSKLNLRGVQEREIMRMIVYVCSQEKAFNPYYVHLATHLAVDSSHARTLIFTLKSLLTTFSPDKLRPILHTSRFFAEVVVRLNSHRLSLAKILSCFDMSQPPFLRPLHMSGLQKSGAGLWLVSFLSLMLADPNAENEVWTALCIERGGDSVDDPRSNQHLRFALQFMLEKWFRPVLRGQVDSPDAKALLSILKVLASNLQKHLLDRIQTVARLLKQ